MLQVFILISIRNTHFHPIGRNAQLPGHRPMNIRILSHLLTDKIVNHLNSAPETFIFLLCQHFQLLFDLLIEL